MVARLNVCPWEERHRADVFGFMVPSRSRVFTGCQQSVLAQPTFALRGTTMPSPCKLAATLSFEVAAGTTIGSITF
jgi:hypothetical protein